MSAGERLRAARERVNEACGILAAPAGFRLELCVPLLENVRELLSETAPLDAADRPGARALVAGLERAGALARVAAAFYRECGWRSPQGAGGYTPQGSPAAEPHSVRILTEA